METRHLHIEGPALSRIVAGCWRWNGVDVDALIRTSLDEGITSFDHADIYGDYENQKLFGKVLRQEPSLRRQIQIVSKCGIRLMSPRYPEVRIKHYDTSRDHIIASVENTLSELRTDYLDLLLIHRPDPFMDYEEVSEAFGLLRQNGKVLHFGVSNFTDSQFVTLQSFLPFPLVTNQVELSLARPQALFDGTLDALARHEVTPMAWSPLGGGKLITDHRNTGFWSLKEKYKVSEMQLALAWLLAHPSHVLPVIGTTRPERIRESAAAVNVQLDRQDWFQLLKDATGSEVP